VFSKEKDMIGHQQPVLVSSPITQSEYFLSSSVDDGKIESVEGRIALLEFLLAQ